MIGVLKRAWIPLLLVVVAVVAGFTVDRIRGFFGSEGILVTPKILLTTPSRSTPKWSDMRSSARVATPTSTIWTWTPSRNASTVRLCRGR